MSQAKIKIPDLNMTGTPSNTNVLRGDGSWGTPISSSYASNSDLLGGQSSSYYLPSSSIDNIVQNDTDIYGSTQKVSQIVSLTSVEYAAIVTKDSGTLYVII